MAITLLAFAWLAVTAWAELTVSVESPVVLCAGSGEQPISATFSGEGAVWVEIYGSDGTQARADGTGTATAIVYVDTGTWNRTIEFNINSSDGSFASVTVYVVGITGLSCDEGSGPFCAPATLHFTATSEPVDSGSACAVVWGPEDTSDTLAAQMTFDPEETRSEVVSAAIGYSVAYLTITINKLRMTVTDAFGTVLSGSARSAPGCCLLWKASPRGGCEPYNITARRTPPIPPHNPCGAQGDVYVHPPSVEENASAEIMFPSGLGPTTILEVVATDAVGCTVTQTVTLQIRERTYAACGQLRWGGWELVTEIPPVTVAQAGDKAQFTVQIQQQAFDTRPVLAEACELIDTVCKQPKVRGGAAVAAFLISVAPELEKLIAASDFVVQAVGTLELTVDKDMALVGVFLNEEFCDKTVTVNDCSTRWLLVSQPVGATAMAWYCGENDPPPRPLTEHSQQAVAQCPCDNTEHPF